MKYFIYCFAAICVIHDYKVSALRPLNGLVVKL